MKRMIVSLLSVVVLAATAASQVPTSSHVVLLLEENHSYSSVVGSSAMPYLNSLIDQYGLATKYFANTHPSIGNYFMLTTGQIITNNDDFGGTVSADNIVRQLLVAGKTWRSYAESLPRVGYTGGDTGAYEKHHNPFAYFTDVVNSSSQSTNLVPFTQFATDLANNQLPDYSFVVPNNNHNAHDCPAGLSTCSDSQKLAAADQWLKTNIAPLLTNTAFQQDGILVIVFDESNSSDSASGGGHVAWVVAGPKVRSGFQSTTFFQHQSTLRLTCDALQIDSSLCPGAGATAPTMGEFFTTSTQPPPTGRYGQIGGTIRDDDERTGVKSATVVISGPKQETDTTDTAGFYKSGKLAAGLYTITVSAPNFVTQTKTATVKAGASTTVDFLLEETAEE